MEYQEDKQSDGKFELTSFEKAGFATGAVLAVVGLGGLGILKAREWRHNRRMDKIQEEYNKIYEEWKYYQGEESA